MPGANSRSVDAPKVAPIRRCDLENKAPDDRFYGGILVSCSTPSFSSAARATSRPCIRKRGKAAPR